MELIIRLTADGQAVMIADDEVRNLAEDLNPHPTAPTRAGYVEPNAVGDWVADLSPIGGPAFAPCRLRSEALMLERAYVNNWLEGEAYVRP